MSKLFVGNIPFSSSENEVRAWMEAEGFAITSVELVHDRGTGQFRGFGFATLADASQAALAVASLNRKRMFGRVITVAQATLLDSETRRTA
jgi:RNA recognition motif-containing protein